jgi:hypothetical protein
MSFEGLVIGACNVHTGKSFCNVASSGNELAALELDFVNHRNHVRRLLLVHKASMQNLSNVTRALVSLRCACYNIPSVCPSVRT